jgi:hypothetical protein
MGTPDKAPRREVTSSVGEGPVSSPVGSGANEFPVLQMAARRPERKPCFSCSANFRFAAVTLR